TARRSRRPFSEVVQDLLEEALRMRQCPGIYFADEPAGREAKVAGTGLSVWEVIRDYLAEGRDETKLREALPHLTPAQIKGALLYYRGWPKEIDELIADNAEAAAGDRKSTRLNSSHGSISYAVFCLNKN